MQDHIWLLDVFEAISIYADENGMSDLAASATQGKAMALKEILLAKGVSAAPNAAADIHVLASYSPVKKGCLFHPG